MFLGRSCKRHTPCFSSNVACWLLSEGQVTSWMKEIHQNAAPSLRLRKKSRLLYLRRTLRNWLASLCLPFLWPLPQALNSCFFLKRGVLRGYSRVPFTKRLDHHLVWTASVLPIGGSASKELVGNSVSAFFWDRCCSLIGERSLVPTRCCYAVLRLESSCMSQ